MCPSSNLSGASSLPPTGSEAPKAHCQRVKKFIIDDITEHHTKLLLHAIWLTVYIPGLGITAGARKFGRDGDFITAPEYCHYSPDV